jgi:hypothetical protein
VLPLFEVTKSDRFLIAPGALSRQGSPKGDGKHVLPAAPNVAFPAGTTFAAQTPSRLMPSFLHVLPSPFGDLAVEQAYQAHFDRLKVFYSPYLCSSHAHPWNQARPKCITLTSCCALSIQTKPGSEERVADVSNCSSSTRWAVVFHCYGCRWPSTS